MPGIEDRFWHLLSEGAAHYALTILSIGVLVATALWLRSWYREDADTAGEPLDLLLKFKDLERQGDLTKDEYRSISSRLTGDRADAEDGTDASATQNDQQDANPQEQ